jgi:aspartyl-tRNA(Asn)/glutamyl-tRNA(Gln) amidotransferase subunit C
VRVTVEEVLHCARLTHLTLAPEEIEPLRRDMEAILDHARSLAELDLEGVEPTTHGQEATLAGRREDVPAEPFTQAQALAGAPDPDRGHFRVPRVL